MPWRGWWSDHEYKRHSVQDISSFCGYQVLRDLMVNADLDTERLIPILFLTGGRLNEIMPLKRSNFIIGGEDKDTQRSDFIKVTGMVVEKQKETTWRTFSWHRSEPLTDDLLDYLYTLGKDELLIKQSASWVYKRITNLVRDEDGKSVWWSHRLRAERASQLVTSYNFTDAMLMRWFG